MLNLRTISDQRTELQHKSRNIFLDKAQTEVDLHGGGSYTNAFKMGQP